MSNELSVTIPEAIVLTRLYLEARLPVMFHGDPGAGKSAMAFQIAASVNMDLRDIRLPLYDFVDVCGLPYMLDGVSHHALAEMWPTAADRPTIVFLDEINRAPALVQNTALQPVLTNMIGRHALPDTTRYLAAVNDADTGTTKMSAALSSRFQHIYLRSDAPAWLRWAENDAQPAVVLAYIQTYPERLTRFERSATSFPCPRSWANVGALLRERDIPTPLILPAFAGILGDSAGGEFATFYHQFLASRNFNVREIFADPEHYKVPSNPGTLYAVTEAIAQQMDATNIGAALTYASRYTEEEYVVYLIRSAIRRDPSLQHTTEFVHWGISQQYTL